MKYWCVIDISGKSKRFVTAHRDRQGAQRELRFVRRHFIHQRFVMEQVDDHNIPEEILEASNRSRHG